MRALLKISGKRKNFISIQNSHTLPCKGYHQPMVRTGYDTVVAHRVPDLFAKTAKEPMTVVSLDKYGIILENDKGESFGYQIGRRFGNAAGLVIPHSIVTPLKVGDKVNVGDPIIYNDGFFEPDFFDPKQICLKMSCVLKTLLFDSIETFEDANAISPRVTQALSTNVTEVKTVVVSFDQVVHAHVKEGDEVNTDTVLCTIEDATSASSFNYDQKTLDTLRIVGAQTPRAHVKGKVEKIEVFYHGELERMTAQLKALCEASDRAMRKRFKSAGMPQLSGSVDSAMRIEGNPLMPEQVAFRFYITRELGHAVGDKLVLANQMKSVTGEVLEESLVTEKGEHIDVWFSLRSVYARIVNSPQDIGSTNTTLDKIAEAMVSVYEGGPRPTPLVTE